LIAWLRYNQAGDRALGSALKSQPQGPHPADAEQLAL